MKNKSSIENKIKTQYENIWSNTSKINRNSQDLNLGWHFGFYEKGVETYQDAIINMNDYVGRLLNLDDNVSKMILDAGCGVGPTSIYLARKYSKNNYIGITLASKEIALAEKIQKENHVKNVKFIQGSYVDTGCSINVFDSVFALESVCYAQNKQRFINEMNRVLKPEGKIVVIDIFRKHDLSNSLIRNINYNFLKQQDSPAARVTIDTFKSFLETGGFGGIKIHDLLKTGNVKHFLLYGFIIRSLYANLSSQFKEIKDLRKNNSLADSFTRKCAFVFVFILKALLTYKSKPGYYSITAVKK